MMRHYTVVDRFIKYVQIDTESDPESSSVPSTMKQKDLGRELVNELLAMGISDAHMDEKGYVYATVKSNIDHKVPTICFCSHMDTSPDCSGKNVKPVIHRNYQGEVIQFADDEQLRLDPKDHPDLNMQIGDDVITASGLTLLGADNKAGVAEIMDAVYQWSTDSNLKHGDIRILFTPDEEIGRGADHVDIAKLNADFGYTIDGETLGSLENETFSADAVKISIQGVSIHPGFALNKLENAAKIAGDILHALPKNERSPETTSKKQPFYHPVSVSGGAESAKLDFIVRSFDTAELRILEKELQDIVDSVMKNYPHSTYTFEVIEQYRNMKEVLDEHPQVVELAKKAMENLNIQVKQQSIRGGTDGSRLSFMGLPCPNIFAGEHAFHSRIEWVGVRDMKYAVDTILEIAKLNTGLY